MSALISTVKLFLFLLLTTSYLLLATPARAQIPTATTGATISTTIPSSYNLQNLPQYTDNLVLSLMHTFSCFMAGVSPIGQPCLSSLKPLSDKGAIDSMTGLIGLLFTNPPTHTATYMGSILQNFGVKPAYAQVGGSGSLLLDVVFRLWEVSRNVAYIAMTIIFVVIGLMIMFRSKINPQTIVTLQAALPGLVIGLIMITFSYFFASLMVDAAYAGTWVIGGYFAQTQPTGVNIVGSTNTIKTENILTILSHFASAAGDVNFQAAVQPVVDNIQGPVRNALGILMFILGCQFASQVTGPLGQINLFGIPLGGLTIAGACATVGGHAAANPAFWIGFFIWFVVLFVFLTTMLNLLRQLITNYVMILFLTFTAPFHFLAAALPGQSAVAENWFRNMLCNVLAFPSVFAAFYFAAYLFGPNKNLHPLFQVTNGLTTPNQTVPLFAGLDQSILRFLAGFGVLAATPAIPNVICQTIGRVGRASQLIEQEIQGGIRGGQGRVSTIQGGIGSIGGALKGIKWKA